MPVPAARSLTLSIISYPETEALYIVPFTAEAVKYPGSETFRLGTENPAGIVTFKVPYPGEPAQVFRPASYIIFIVLPVVFMTAHDGSRCDAPLGNIGVDVYVTVMVAVIVGLTYGVTVDEFVGEIMRVKVGVSVHVDVWAAVDETEGVGEIVNVGVLEGLVGRFTTGAVGSSLRALQDVAANTTRTTAAADIILILFERIYELLELGIVRVKLQGSPVIPDGFIHVPRVIAAIAGLFICNGVIFYFKRLFV
jgi:hypothetical protein